MTERYETTTGAQMRGLLKQGLDVQGNVFCEGGEVVAAFEDGHDTAAAGFIRPLNDFARQLFETGCGDGKARKRVASVGIETGGQNQ